MLNHLQLLGLALAGAAGTLSRYGLGLMIDSRWLFDGHSKIYGTFVANSLGCMLFGLAFAWFNARMLDDHPLRIIVLVGFMGSFTTFSAFAHLTTDLAFRNYWWAAGGHILLHVIVGIGLFLLGSYLGGMINRGLAA